MAVALSVDGLNTIDARVTTAAHARKWVLGPYETVTISGWQTSQLEARRFEFTTEARSYGQALGKTANLGVISVVFFKERVSTIMRDTLNDDRGRGMPAAPPSAPRQQEAAVGRGAAKRADDEFAATGMGRRTDHAVTQVWLDLEDAPAQTVNIRYEFRPQLVRLGILPPAPTADPLQRRERAHGFEPGFSPNQRSNDERDASDHRFGCRPLPNLPGAAVGVKLRARTGSRDMLVGLLLAAMTPNYSVDHHQDER